MTVKVKEDDCAGCSACVDVCPEVFEVVDGVAKVKLRTIPEGLEKSVREAAESCPTEAIVIQKE